ncbi:MAG: SGNH/GDSL hydrolase family protein [Deltaproteobacteria bacterium]|nr:SGNH/GDSL hydrolase family protein [Deltaproteobacteria bacterium]
MKIKRTIGILVSTGAGILLLFLFLEIAVRLSGYSKKYLYDPIYKKSDLPGVVYEHKPDVDGRARSGTPVHIDNIGARSDRDYPILKPGNTCRVVLLGDSWTFGQGVELQHTFGYLLERKLLPGRFPSYHFEVINLGVCGYNIANMVASFVQKAIRLNPDVVVLALIGEDLSLDRRLAADKFGYTRNLLSPQVPDWLKSWLRNLHMAYWIRDKWWILTHKGEQGLKGVEEPGAPVYRKTWNRAGKLLQEFRDKAKEENIRTLIIDLDFKPKHSAEMLKRLAGKLGVPFVACSQGVSVSAKSRDIAQLVLPNDGHPGIKGHELIASLLLEAITAQLSNAGCMNSL